MNNKTILIIEDERALLEVVKNKLTKEGFNVLTARRGEDGLVLALKNHPDLILLDLVLPTLDGMSLLHKLREDSWGKKAKVIILTNLGDAEKAEEAAAKGVFDYMIKAEWKLKDIVTKVREKLEIKD